MSEEPSLSIRSLASGTAALGVLMSLYYGTVVLAGLHFTVLQVISLWGLALMLVPGIWRSLTLADAAVIMSITAMFVVALASYSANGLWGHPDGNLSRYGRYLFFVPIYFVARRFATPRTFWIALLIGVLATGIWGILEYAGLVRHPDDIRRDTSVSGAVNSIQFGDLSLAMAAMTCAGLPVFRAYGRPFMVTAICGAVLAFVACIGSNTRGAWIAVPALALLIGGVFVHSGFVKFRSLLAIALVAALLVGALLPRTQAPAQMERALSEIQDYRRGVVRRSVGVRFELWKASWQIYLDHPVLGVGPGLYFSEAQALSAAGGYDREALKYTNPLSEYFFALATLGTAGLLALLLLFLWPLSRYVKLLASDDVQLRSLGLAGGVLVLGYMQFGLTEGMLFQHATFLGFYLLSTAVLISSIDRRRRELTGETPA